MGSDAAADSSGGTVTDADVRVPGATFVEDPSMPRGFTVRYLVAGDGPAVVYLPGAGGPVMTFALDALAERFKVIVIEFPGWGSQPNDVDDFDGLADQVAEIAAALGLERFHLMGTSFGGACALHFVVRHTDMVESLVLESPGKFRESSVHPSTLAPDDFVKAFRSHPDRVPHMSPPDPEFMARVWPTVERLMGDGADDGLLALVGAGADADLDPVRPRRWNHQPDQRSSVASRDVQFVAAVRLRRGSRHPVRSSGGVCRCRRRLLRARHEVPDQRPRRADQPIVATVGAMSPDRSRQRRPSSTQRRVGIESKWLHDSPSSAR